MILLLELDHTELTDPPLQLIVLPLLKFECFISRNGRLSILQAIKHLYIPHIDIASFSYPLSHTL